MRKFTKTLILALLLVSGLTACKSKEPPVDEDPYVPTLVEYTETTVPSDFYVEINNYGIGKNVITEKSIKTYKCYVPGVNSQGYDDPHTYYGFKLVDIVEAIKPDVTIGKVTAIASDGHEVEYTNCPNAMIAFKKDTKNEIIFANVDSKMITNYNKGLVKVTVEGMNSLADPVKNEYTQTIEDFEFTLNGNTINKASLTALTAYSIAIQANKKTLSVDSNTYVGYLLKDILASQSITLTDASTLTLTAGSKTNTFKKADIDDNFLIAFKKDSTVTTSGVYICPGSNHFKPNYLDSVTAITISSN